MKKRVLTGVIFTLVVATAAVILISSCTQSGSPIGGDLYMGDTYNGRIYTYDASMKMASSVPIFTAEEAISSMAFHVDTGFIAVGNNYSNSPGLYYFDPQATVIQAQLVPGSGGLGMAYMAFYSDTEAYVTYRDYGVGTGVYYFNPSNPLAGIQGPITGTDKSGKSDRYLGMIIIGTDNKIYVSDATDAYPSGQNQVLQIDPAIKTVTNTYNLTGAGVGGMVAMDNAGSPTIEVVSSSGELESIDLGTGDVTTLITGVTTNLLLWNEDNTSYYATGYDSSYSLHTFQVEVTGIGTPTYTVTELLDEDSAFGGDDMKLLDDGFIYIANYSYITKESLLYVIDPISNTQTSWSPLSVMKNGEDGFVAMAVY